MKELRQRAGLKAEEVSVKLGIARSTLGNWEQGKAVPHFDVIANLLDLYQCSFEELRQAVDLTRKKEKENITRTNSRYVKDQQSLTA
ncbi:MAG: helix-turn-helix domain-containing protein [Xenococcaceae cyanobacterium]